MSVYCFRIWLTHTASLRCQQSVGPGLPKKPFRRCGVQPLLSLKICGNGSERKKTVLNFQQAHSGQILCRLKSSGHLFQHRESLMTDVGGVGKGNR